MLIVLIVSFSFVSVMSLNVKKADANPIIIGGVAVDVAAFITALMTLGAAYTLETTGLLDQPDSQAMKDWAWNLWDGTTDAMREQWANATALIRPNSDNRYAINIPESIRNYLNDYLPKTELNANIPKTLEWEPGLILYPIDDAPTFLDRGNNIRYIMSYHAGNFDYYIKSFHLTKVLDYYHFSAQYTRLINGDYDYASTNIAVMTFATEPPKINEAIAKYFDYLNDNPTIYITAYHGVKVNVENYLPTYDAPYSIPSTVAIPAPWINEGDWTLPRVGVEEQIQTDGKVRRVPLVGNPAITTTAEAADVTDLTGAMPASVSNFDDVPSEMPKLYAVTTKFPFSLPWDVYRIVALFAADPITPIINVDEKYRNMPIKFSADLSRLDPYMPFFRFLLAVGFAVMLIFRTPTLLGGGK